MVLLETYSVVKERRVLRRELPRARYDDTVLGGAERD